MARPLDRRQMLGASGGVALLAVIGCGAGDSGGAESCRRIPEETAGPFPGDGTNGPDALASPGVVRSDIRSSFGNLTGTAEGVPLRLTLQILSRSGCLPLAGAAVHVWHCDRAGNYSLYTLPSQNYLRGVQAALADGRVTFQTIFPGCYPGRWPHIHFEVFPDLAAAGSASGKIATSQLAFPASACDAAYEATGYASSAQNLSHLSLASDGVFADGVSQQTALVTGSAAAGFVASLVVTV